MRSDSCTSFTPNETPSASRQHPRDIDVDPPTDSAPSSTTAAAPPSPPAVSAPPDDNDDDLEHQSREFLLQRARALDRQLKVRNSDCARLLTERQQLLPLREKCESQKEMILALRGQLDLARAQRESAVDAMETMKRRQRDQEHRDRVANAERAMYAVPPQQREELPPSLSQRPSTAAPTTAISPKSNNGHSSPPPTASTPNIGRRNPGGTVVSTAAGPQLLYDSSDISSVGFTKNAKLPYDFLGGPGAQQQYLSRYSSGGDVPDGGHDESEDGQVRRVINAAKDQAEMEAKYAEMEDREEEALMARIKALRQGRK